MRLIVDNIAIHAGVGVYKWERVIKRLIVLNLDLDISECLGAKRSCQENSCKSLVSVGQGEAVAYAIFNLQDRGKMLVIIICNCNCNNQIS